MMGDGIVVYDGIDVSLHITYIPSELRIIRNRFIHSFGTPTLLRHASDSVPAAVPSVFLIYMYIYIFP